MNDERLLELTKRIHTFNREREWDQFHDPKNLALSLQLEASEVLELFQWTQDNNIRKEKVGELAGELADVYYWLLMLAEKHKINLIEALEKKMDLNEKKYPIDKAKGNSAKYTELN